MNLVSFNSRLVRLVARPPVLWTFTSHVSIPDWCDWQSPSGCRTTLKVVFQFQIGAIGSHQVSLMRSMLICFNSRLVRLVEKIFFLSSDFRRCFNSRLVRFVALRSGRTTSGNSRFNSRLVRLVASLDDVVFVNNNVSIPDWCDWQNTCSSHRIQHNRFNSRLVRLVVH